MKVDPGSGLHVGKQGEFAEKQDQAGALAEVRRCGASAEEASGFGEELIREGRAMKGRRARHETAPRANGQLFFSGDPLTIDGTRPFTVWWSGCKIASSNDLAR
jgi:hypothetical protein